MTADSPRYPRIDATFISPIPETTLLNTGIQIVRTFLSGKLAAKIHLGDREPTDSQASDGLWRNMKNTWVIVSRDMVL